MIQISEELFDEIIETLRDRMFMGRHGEYNAPGVFELVERLEKVRDEQNDDDQSPETT